MIPAFSHYLELPLGKSMGQDMNMTMVLAEFDLKNKQLTLANVGQHAYPLLVRNNQVETIKAKGMPLDMIPSIPCKTLATGLKSGDLLLDGITNRTQKRTGENAEESSHFHQFISNLPTDLSAQGVVDQVIDDVPAIWLTQKAEMTTSH